MISEDFRDKRFAVMTLTCLGLFFFYLAVFNKPESHLSCLSRSTDNSATDFYLNIDGMFFKVMYGLLAAIAMMGNMKRYPVVLTLGCVLWVVWAGLCLTYDLAMCDIPQEVKNTESMRFSNFVAVLLAHYVLAGVGLLGVMRKPQYARLSTSNPINFPTPVRVNVALILAIWIILNLFLSTLHTVINLFRAVHDLEAGHTSDSWEGALATLLTPLPYALLTGAIVGITTGFISIWSLHRHYRKIVTHILKREGRCKWLKKAWKCGTHNGMFFIVQFVANSLYLYILALYIVATFAFFVYSKWFYEVIWAFLKVRPLWLPLFMIPFLVKWFYLPRLIDKPTNHVRNLDYFNFWFLLVSVFAVLVAFFRAFFRFFIGICLLIGFGYRSDQSIFPAGWESLDALYTSFCGMVTIHCLEAGVTPIADAPSPQPF